MGILNTAATKGLKAIGLNTDAQLSSPPSPDFESFKIYEIVNGKKYDLPNDSNYGIVLAGSFMPHNTLDFGGSQQIIKDYYPGAKEPTIQVLGSRESDVSIKGRLYTKHLKTEDRSVYVGEISESYQRQMDAIRLRGNLLQLEMGEWVRWGFLEKSTFKLSRLVDIEYELNFVITGFTRPTNCKFTGNQYETVAASNKSLNNAAANLLLSQKNYPDSMPRSLSEFLNAKIGAVANVVANVTGFIDGAVGDVESVLGSANRALGMIKYARSYISKTMRELGTITYNVSNLGSAFSSESAKAAAQIRNAKFVNDTKSGMFSLSAYLAQLQLKYKDLSDTIPLARHFVKQGDTLQKVAIKFYNAPDRWKDIYDHNRLTTTALVNGTILEIPK